MQEEECGLLEKLLFWTYSFSLQSSFPLKSWSVLGGFRKEAHLWERSKIIWQKPVMSRIQTPQGEVPAYNIAFWRLSWLNTSVSSMKCLPDITRKTCQDINLKGSQAPAENEPKIPGDSPLSACWCSLSFQPRHPTGWILSFPWFHPLLADSFFLEVPLCAASYPMCDSVGDPVTRCCSLTHSSFPPALGAIWWKDVTLSSEQSMLSVGPGTEPVFLGAVCEREGEKEGGICRAGRGEWRRTEKEGKGEEMRGERGEKKKIPGSSGTSLMGIWTNTPFITWFLPGSHLLPHWGAHWWHFRSLSMSSNSHAVSGSS